MARVVWTPEAIDDIVRLYQFVASESPDAAKKIAGLLKLHTDLLVETPGIGRRIDSVTNRRELYIPFGSGRYIVSYEQDQAGDPLVLRVWHSREDRNPV